MKRAKLILEFTEFNSQRLNPDSAQMAVHVDNPQLSINAFDRHEDGIRAGMSRINNILNSLSNSSSFRSLKSKFALEEQQIKSIKILRILNADNVNFDVYVSFIIDETEYWGVIEDILNREPIFKSEVFKDYDLIQNKEWIIRTKGLIIKTIKTWLYPENGLYKLLEDSIVCNSVHTGRLQRIEKGSEIEVVKAYDNKILIKWNGDIWNLVGRNFVYFNWWFQKLDN